MTLFTLKSMSDTYRLEDAAEDNPNLRVVFC